MKCFERKIRKTLVFIIMFCLSFFLLAESFSFTNRFSVYGNEDLNRSEFHPEFDFQWLAMADVTIFQNENYELKSYVSLQNRMNLDFEASPTFTAKLYRGWVRIGSMQTTLRLGLQQLNFGSAKNFRPLQWFDYLNPLDLVPVTEGVEAVLLRHFFDNGMNAWVWGILGKEKRKGLELFPSEKGSLESGGRFQFPFVWGETAFTFHQRKTKSPFHEKAVSEYRAGFDMRMDSFFGLWIEAAGSYLEKNKVFETNYQTMTTLGFDYTFAVENGLYFMSETALVHFGKSYKQLQNDSVLSAVMLDYPLSIFDTITLLNQYEWQENMFIHSFVFRRTYDYLSFQLMLNYDFNTNNYESVKYVQITVNYDL